MSKKVNRKFLQTKNKVSKIWSKYDKEKQKIISKKRLPLDFKNQLIKDLQYDTKESIRQTWEDYKEEEYLKSKKSDIDNAFLTKIHKTENTIQKNYKLTENYNHSDLDNDIPRLLDNEKIAGVQVIFRVYDEENERYIYGSDLITKGLAERLQEKNISIYDHVAQKLAYSKSCQDFELKSIHLRVIESKA